MLNDIITRFNAGQGVNDSELIEILNIRDGKIMLEGIVYSLSDITATLNTAERIAHMRFGDNWQEKIKSPVLKLTNDIKNILNKVIN